MKSRRLFALIGLIFSLVLSLTVPAPAQKTGKATNSGKLTNPKLPKGKEAIIRQTSSVTPNLTGCPSTFPITPGVTVNGSLTAGDCPLPDGSRFDEWTFNATAGQTINIRMTSTTPGFDTYLILMIQILIRSLRTMTAAEVWMYRLPNSCEQ